MGKACDERLAARLVGTGILHEVYDLGGCGLTETLCRLDAQHAGDVDTAGDDFTANVHAAWHALTGEGHRVEAGGTLNDSAVEWDLFSGLHHNGLSDLHVSGCYNGDLSSALYVGGVGADVHELGDRFTAAVLGIVLKEFTDLEEQHHEDSLGKLRFGTGEEADEQGTDGGDRHEEVLVKGIALTDTFPCFAQHVVAHDQVGHEVDNQLTPYGHRYITGHEPCT